MFCLFITAIVETSGWFYTVWVCLGYFCLGAHFIMLPLAMTNIFGLKSGGQLASMAYCSRALSALVSTLLADSLSDSMGEDSYRAMFYISCGFIALSASVNIFCFEESTIRKVDTELELPLLSNGAKTQVKQLAQIGTSNQTREYSPLN